MMFSMPVLSKPVICDSQTYANIPTLARAFDKPLATVFQRIKNHNWTPEEAVGLVPRYQRTTGHEVLVSGVRYRSRQAACVALGLNPFRYTQLFSCFKSTTYES